MPSKENITQKMSPGRKPLSEGVKTIGVTLKMTVVQREKLARLGGAPWVREKIDKAKEPEK
jgi:hypothetical protein